MADDEFFKRIAEAQVEDEPATDRPLGTAARRAARAKPKASKAPGDDAEQESVNTAERARSPQPGRRKAERVARGRRWNGRRVAAICAGLGAVAAVAASAVSVLGGVGEEGPGHRTEIVVEFVPRAFGRVKPRHAQGGTAARSGEPAHKRNTRKHPPAAPRRTAAPLSEIPQGPATSAPATSIGAREGFGFERGSG